MRHFKHSVAPGLEHLWVIVPISNPARYRSRYELFQNFKRMLEKARVNYMIVELALGDRPFECTEAGNPFHVQLRTWDEMWHKENMINVAIGRLPADWQYVAWVDADIGFQRDDWAEEIVHLLQHYQVIQLFQNAVDLGPEGEVMQIHNGLMWSFVTGQPEPFVTNYYGSAAPNWHSGYAWAARREAIDHLGGLYDQGILGSSDWLMAWALLGKLEKRIHTEFSDGYKKSMLTWQDRANRHIKQDVGYMNGTIYHHWHGKKADRRYMGREQILANHKFDPHHDIKKDWQGLHAFTEQGERMRLEVRRYFHVRNEDSVDR